MSIVYLKNIATVVSGYSFRESIDFSSEGEVCVLQLKNIHNDGYSLDTDELLKIKESPRKASNYLKKNDIVVSRVTLGGKIRAATYFGKDQKIIVSASLYIIRLYEKEINPQFLTMYINSVHSQKELLKTLTGSTVQGILKETLENLTVPVPSIQTQSLLIHLYENILHQEKLVQQKIKLQKEIFTEIFNQTIKEINL